MNDMLKELKNIVYGYEAEFIGKIILKGVMTYDERKDDNTKK